VTDRGIDQTVIDAIEAGEYAPALFIDAAFEDSAGNDDTLYLWTGVGRFPWNGNEYAGTGTLLTIEGLEEILDVVARGASFTLDGIGVNDVNDDGDDIIDLAYRTEYQNRPVTVRLGFIDRGTRKLLADPVTIFAGRMDVMDPEEDGNECRITLTVENALIALERAVGRTYTDADQQDLYDGDTFFEQVAELQNMEIQLD